MRTITISVMQSDGKILISKSVHGGMATITEKDFADWLDGPLDKILNDVISLTHSFRGKPLKFCPDLPPEVRNQLL